MISEDQAKQLALSYINRPNPDWPNMPEMVITVVDPAPLGWLIWWTSALYWQTKDSKHAIAGNLPIYVARETGDFETVGFPPHKEDSINEAEAKLRKKIDSGNRE